MRAAGYPGGYARVNEYVRQVRPRDPVEPLQRFETPPGCQGQVDFGTFKLPWGRRHALSVVLGHSRLLWLRFYSRQTMAVLIEGLESAFARFGGVPQELLFDQMRSVVISDGRTGGGGLVLNAEFLRFAAHWGFMPRSCRPYRARTKGKVERPIRYLRENFFYGRKFLNDADLNEQATRWLNGTANVRRHGTTDERPWTASNATSGARSVRSPGGPTGAWAPRRPPSRRRGRDRRCGCSGARWPTTLRPCDEGRDQEPPRSGTGHTGGSGDARRT